MKRIKIFIAALFGCTPNAEYVGQAIMVKKPSVGSCATPLIRRVSAMRTVSINGCQYLTPHAEPGALVQLTHLNDGWQYQVMHEEPQSTFAEGLTAQSNYPRHADAR